MKKLNSEVVLWTKWVLILSNLCYLPMFLENKGIHISPVVLSSKYLFVTVPLVVSVLFISKRKHMKKWFRALFAEKVKPQAVLYCVVLGSIGLSFSIIYCLIVGNKDIFTSSYPTALAVIISCSYLFVTALIEEIAWRGFLLDEVVAEKGKGIAMAYVGVVWAIWHIPMWAIRNSLELKEILIYFVWTVLVSFILCMLFYRYKSILTVSLAHMIFNTCFITPVEYNVILLVCILILSIIVFNKKIDIT